MMTQQNINTLTLRFSEFSGEWKEQPFSAFLRPAFREAAKPTTKYLAIGVRSHGKGTFSKPDSDPDDIAMETLFVVHENDLVVNITFAWEGAIAIVPKHHHGAFVSHRFPAYEFIRSKVIHEFFAYIIENRRFRQSLEIISPGGAGRNRVLSKSEFLKLSHRFPMVAEQRKIASFLLAIDTRVAQLERKKALLEDYKKGCMQKLFSQEMRFKSDNGSELPKWKEKKFSDVYEFKSTNSFSREMLNYEGGEIRNIHYGDIHTKFKANFFLKREVVPFLNKETDLKGFPPERYCQKGDLVIADASENYADIGKAIEIIDLAGEKVVAGLHTLQARRRGNDLTLGFGALLMASEEVRRQINILAQGTKVLGIAPGRVEKMTLPIPSIEEQKKMVSFLAAIDHKIDFVGKEINGIKIYRRGLLQQMFI